MGKTKIQVGSTDPNNANHKSVEKIISATTPKFATIFKLMAETGVEGEELYQTHRNQFEQTQAILDIKGLKGHGSANYKLKQPTAEMLREYLAKYPQNYPFPQPKVMSKMWRTARETASKNHNDPTLKTIPMKNLRNYSGAQLYYQFPDPIGVMRHLRHKRIETTMRALTHERERALVVHPWLPPVCYRFSSCFSASFSFLRTPGGGGIGDWVPPGYDIASRSYSCSAFSIL